MLPAPLIRLRIPIIIGLHLILVPIGYLLAFLLRFDAPLPEHARTLFLASLLYLLPLRLLAFYPFGLYHGWWRHVGVRDLIDLIRAVSVSTAIFLVALFLDQRLVGFPRSILLLDWVLAIALFGGARFAVRVGRERREVNGDPERRRRPALVIGGGVAADRLLRQLRMGEGDFRAIGLVDDDPAKRGMRLHGVPVRGTIDEIESIAARSGAKLLVIAIPSADREQMKRVVERCAATKLEFKIVPPLNELLDGRAKVSQLRDVEVEDLLGRDPIRLDLELVRRDLAGRTVLVTGGAGSIGAELARQIAGFSPARLIVLDQAESPLYFVHLELARAHPELDVVPIVGDITHAGRLERLFAAYRPDYVFHAAAYKHVPLMEENVVEAVRNNVLGTLHVAEAAARHGASKFVLISTDKAVNPSSVMGATKRVAERIVLGWPELRAAATEYRAVRFGNVLGSDGSVIPVFRRQLAEGGPLTVTHREMTRYFMTIPEAVQLVLQTAALDESSGRIAMLEMGEPVRIVELAENLIRLSGLEPYTDMPIVFSGMRPGEKLHEELMSEVEATVPTRLEKVRLVQTDEADGDAVRHGVDRLAVAATAGIRDDIILGLRALVPECVAPLKELPLRGSAAKAGGAKPGKGALTRLA